MLPAWAGTVLVLLTLGALITGARVFQRVYTPHPELVRKFLHLGMGLLALSLPWLFASPLPVLVLLALGVLGILALRVAQPLKAGLGSVLHGVRRASLGEVYFPLGVGAIFMVSRGDRVLFGIPILVLALADDAAALIGIQYGQLRYSTAEGEKSAEGSLAFFTVAFLTTYITLLLLTRTGRAESLLIALSLALLVMVLEAVSWGGLDNLSIPLGGFVLLKTYRMMDVPHLAACLAVTVILVASCSFWRRF
jgi:phytol kinase